MDFEWAPFHMVSEQFTLRRIKDGRYVIVVNHGSHNEHQQCVYNRCSYPFLAEVSHKKLQEYRSNATHGWDTQNLEGTGAQIILS